MTLILFSLLIGIALGVFLKGAVKVGIVVALGVAAVVFTCRELNVDWHSVMGVAADQATQQWQRVQPTSAPKHRERYYRL